MDLTQSILSYGLRSIAAPTSTNVDNDVEIGVAQTQERFADANIVYSLRAVMVGSASTLSINQETGVCTATTFVPGTDQVETATAVGTITASGNASITVSATSLSGSPTLVPVLIGDTATVWAGKVRTALAANTAIAALFLVGGIGPAISLTRLTNLIGGEYIRSANDSTLNIAIANGTCTGITAAATSSNTTAGVATSGVVLFDGDGKDFEGNELPTSAYIYATLVNMLNGGINYQNTYLDATIDILKGKFLQSFDDGVNPEGSFVFGEAYSAPSASEFTFTVLAKQ